MAKSQWSKLDYFLPMSLVKEENALKDIKGGKVAINGGASKVFEGFEFDGLSNWIDSNFIPNEGINFSLNDAQAIAFFYDFGTADSNNYLFGCSHTTGSTQLYDSSIEQYTYLVNATSTLTYTGVKQSKSSIGVGRSDNNTMHQIIDGVVVINGVGRISSKSPPIPIAINARNNNGLVSLFHDGITSLFDVGAFNGINQIAKNDIYREFLTDLGIDLTPDFNKLAGATITDTLQGATVADELVGT